MKNEETSKTKEYRISVKKPFPGGYSISHYDVESLEELIRVLQKLEISKVSLEKDSQYMGESTIESNILVENLSDAHFEFLIEEEPGEDNLLVIE